MLALALLLAAQALPPPAPGSEPVAMPPPMRPDPHPASPAQPVAPITSYFSEADYPAASIRDRAQGSVAFRLDVGPDGRVTGCMVTRSSGSSALDSATCRILRSRARFRPGRDAAGIPVADTYRSSVVWLLPHAATAVPARPPFDRPGVFSPPPPPPPRAYREPARPVAPISSYVTRADYPREALSARAEGNVGVRLAVGANGRVAGCMITSSSGSSSLDQATCRILRSRARFVPAVGWSGEPVPDAHSARVRWNLPAEPPPPG